MIIDHTNRFYTNILPNGALIYSMNIVKNIIPKVQTKRNWVTIDCKQCMDNAIVFIHSNVDFDRYEYLRKYKNLVLVASQNYTVQELRKRKLGDHVIYLPLSVDTKELRKYKNLKPHYRGGTCYAGRPDKPYVDGLRLQGNIDMLCGLTHPDMLKRLNNYQYCYAVGITAIEAKFMGCTLLPFDKRYPDTRVWKILAPNEAAKILQKKLNKIDYNKQ